MALSFTSSGDELFRKTIKVGSRKSSLALIQTHLVIDELKSFHPELEFVIITRETLGDNILDKPLSKIGEKALFTRELEEELLIGNVDIIVHSLKDIPTILPEKCCIGAITKREDPSDSVVVRADLAQSFPAHCSLDYVLSNDNIKTFGTSSLRRIAQLKSLDQNICVQDIRGNLNTRLAKLDDHQTNGFDCLILAASGLKRANFDNRITLKLDWFHAVSQGALGIECRLNDRFVIDHVLKPLSDLKTLLECTCERVFMKYLEGGCSVPIGVKTIWQSQNTLLLKGIVLSLDGTQQVEAEGFLNLDSKVEQSECKEFDLDDFSFIVLPNSEEFSIKQKRLINCVILGKMVAQKIIEKGGKKILDNIKK